jgi:spore coat protein U-like protein
MNMLAPMIGLKRAIWLFAVTAVVLSAPAAGHAATGTITVTAVVLAKNQCAISTDNLNLDFGALDPVNPVDINLDSSIDFSCTGNAGTTSISVSDDDGRYETGIDLNRMRHVQVATEFIPYSLTITPLSGDVPNDVGQSLGLTLFISGADYKYAFSGAYEDTVVVTLEP